MTKLCLHKLLQFLQPVQFFRFIFSKYVLEKKLANASFYTPDFKVFMQSLLQSIIQVPKDISKPMKNEMSICLNTIVVKLVSVQKKVHRSDTYEYLGAS